MHQPPSECAMRVEICQGGLWRDHVVCRACLRSAVWGWESSDNSRVALQPTRLGHSQCPAGSSNAGEAKSWQPDAMHNRTVASRGLVQRWVRGVRPPCMLQLATQTLSDAHSCRCQPAQQLGVPMGEVITRKLVGRRGSPHTASSAHNCSCMRACVGIRRLMTYSRPQLSTLAKRGRVGCQCAWY
jgi:hypothetical protein